MATQDKADLHCVQCGGIYQEIHNGEGSCKFHTQSRWGRSYECCNQDTVGCQTAKHRNEHHNDYKYYNFIEQVSKVLNYTDANKQWASVEDTNLLNQKNLYCSVGVVTKGIWQGRLFVCFNTRWQFFTFTADELKNKFNDVTTPTEKLLKEFFVSEEQKNNEHEGSTEDVKDFSRALWRIENGKITGITIICQAKTSPHPDHCVVEFEINNSTFKHIKNTFISHGGIPEYKPKTPYQFPIPEETFQYEGGILENHIPSDAEKELVKKFNEEQKEKENVPLEPFCYGSLPLKVIPKTFVVNQTSSFEGDIFILELTIMNSEKSNVVIMNLEVEYQLKGDTNWTKIPVQNEKNKNMKNTSLCKFDDVTQFYLPSTQSLPLTINAATASPQFTSIKVDIFLPYSIEKENPPALRWFDNSYIARLRPLLLKLKFKDLENKVMSYVTEHVNTPRGKQEKDPRYPLQMTIRDPLTWAGPDFKMEASVSKETVENVEVIKDVKISFWHGNSGAIFELDQIRSFVVKAAQAQKNIHAFEVSNTTNGKSAYQAFALIDLNCMRCYGIKVIVSTPNVRGVAYYRMPLYGKLNQQNDIKPVTTEEENKFMASVVQPFKLDQQILEKYVLHQVKGLSYQIIKPKPKVREVPDDNNNNNANNSDNKAVDELKKKVTDLEKEIVEKNKTIEKYEAEIASLKTKNNNDNNNKNKNNAAKDWNNNNVCEFIKSLGNFKLNEAVPFFIEYNVTGQDLLKLNDEQLKDIGIQNSFLRTKLLTEIAKLQ